MTTSNQNDTDELIILSDDIQDEPLTAPIVEENNPIDNQESQEDLITFNQEDVAEELITQETSSETQNDDILGSDFEINLEESFTQPTEDKSSESINLELESSDDESVLDFSDLGNDTDVDSDPLLTTDKEPELEGSDEIQSEDLLSNNDLFSEETESELKLDESLDETNDLELIDEGTKDDQEEIVDVNLGGEVDLSSGFDMDTTDVQNSALTDIMSDDSTSSSDDINTMEEIIDEAIVKMTSRQSIIQEEENIINDKISSLEAKIKDLQADKKEELQKKKELATEDASIKINVVKLEKMKTPSEK